MTNPNVSDLHVANKQKALVGMGYHFIRDLNDEFEKGWRVVPGTFISAGGDLVMCVVERETEKKNNATA